MTTVVNKLNDSFDVYIGRGSIWGNPFKRSQGITRTEAIENYRTYAMKNIEDGIWSKDMIIEELEGKRLGCYCKPKSCHGDILVEIVNHIGFEL